VGVAHAAYFPEMGVGASASEETTQRTFDGHTTSLDAFDQTRFATLTWRLLDFGGRLAHNTAAQASLTAALNSQDAAVQKVLLSVTAAYFEVQMAQARKSAAAQAESATEQAQATVARRSAHGAASQADVLQATAATARAALRTRRAAGGLARARVQLQQALGADGTPLPPLLGLSESAEPAPIDGPDAWASLSEFHPALRAAQAHLRSAEAKQRAVRAEALPTVDLRNTRQLHARSTVGPAVKTDITSLSLTLRIPLFDGFANRHRLRGAAAQVALREAERDAIALDIRRQIHLACADAESSLQAWHAAHALAGAAERANQSAQRRFDAGAGDVLAWLSAQTALAEAREERFRAMAEWHAAHLALLSSAGVLNRSAITWARSEPGVE
jgi:outer membrane protein